MINLPYQGPTKHQYVKLEAFSPSACVTVSKKFKNQRESEMEALTGLWQNEVFQSNQSGNSALQPRTRRVRKQVARVEKGFETGSQACEV